MLQSAMSSTRVCTAFIKRIQSLSYVPFHPRNVHFRCFLKRLLKDFFLLRFKSNTINCGLNYQKKNNSSLNLLISHSFLDLRYVAKALYALIYSDVIIQPTVSIQLFGSCFSTSSPLLDAVHSRE